MVLLSTCCSCKDSNGANKLSGKSWGITHEYWQEIYLDQDYNPVTWYEERREADSFKVFKSLSNPTLNTEINKKNLWRITRSNPYYGWVTSSPVAIHPLPKGNLYLYLDDKSDLRLVCFTHNGRLMMDQRLGPHQPSEDRMHMEEWRLRIKKDTVCIFSDRRGEIWYVKGLPENFDGGSLVKGVLEVVGPVIYDLEMERDGTGRNWFRQFDFDPETMTLTGLKRYKSDDAGFVKLFEISSSGEVLHWVDILPKCGLRPGVMQRLVDQSSDYPDYALGPEGDVALILNPYEVLLWDRSESKAHVVDWQELPFAKKLGQNTILRGIYLGRERLWLMFQDKDEKSDKPKYGKFMCWINRDLMLNREKVDETETRAVADSDAAKSWGVTNEFWKQIYLDRNYNPVTWYEDGTADSPYYVYRSLREPSLNNEVSESDLWKIWLENPNLRRITKHPDSLLPLPRGNLYLYLDRERMLRLMCYTHDGQKMMDQELGKYDPTQNGLRQEQWQMRIKGDTVCMFSSLQATFWMARGLPEDFDGGSPVKGNLKVFGPVCYDIESEPDNYQRNRFDAFDFDPRTLTLIGLKRDRHEEKGRLKLFEISKTGEVISERELFSEIGLRPGSVRRMAIEFSVRSDTAFGPEGDLLFILSPHKILYWEKSASKAWTIDWKDLPFEPDIDDTTILRTVYLGKDRVWFHFQAMKDNYYQYDFGNRTYWIERSEFMRHARITNK
jgi:hypothetical protein